MGAGARDRLRMLYLEVLRLAGRWEMLTTVDPTDERAHLELIAALARRGDRRAALRQFERLERALRSELGVAPSRSAERLRQRLLAEESGGSAAAADRARLRRPLASGVAVHGHPGSLGSGGGFELVGRERERERLERVIVDMSAGQGRTLFLGGPPGIGKTAVLAWLESRCAAERHPGRQRGSGADRGRLAVRAGAGGTGGSLSPSPRPTRRAR